MKPLILVLTSTWPRTEHDHEPRFVADLCQQLRRSFRLIVLTQHRPGTATHEEHDDMIVIRFRYAPDRLEMLSENGGISTTLNNNPWAWSLVPLLVCSQVFSIWKILYRHSPDIIHAHWLIPQGLAAVTGKFLAGKKIPIICTSHGADVYSFRSRLFGYLKKSVIRTCTRYCVVSTAMKSEVQSKLFVKTKINVLPMGADLSHQFTWNKYRQFNPGELLFVGRLVEKKGVAYLLHALKKLLETDTSVKLNIVGYGPERTALESLATVLDIKHRVEFRGGLPHSELAKLYRESEVCVLPFVESRDGDSEGHPLVPIEAMGCGCPVVVGDIPTIRDIVIDNQTGLLCNPRETSVLAKKIQSIMYDEGLRKRLTLTGHTHVNREFSWDACTNRYHKLFLSVLTNQK